MPAHRYPREPLLRSGLVRASLALLILAASVVVSRAVLASPLGVCVLRDTGGSNEARTIFYLKGCDGTVHSWKLGESV